MKCNIVELGGTKNGFFTRNHFVDVSQIKNNLKLFDGDIYSTINISVILFKICF